MGADRQMPRRSAVHLMILLAMHGLWRKGRKADGDVLGAFLTGSAIADPFTWQGDDGLARMNFVYTALGFDAHGPAQDDRDFLELGLLCGLLPTAGRHHPGDADVLSR